MEEQGNPLRYFDALRRELEVGKDAVGAWSRRVHAF